MGFFEAIVGGVKGGFHGILKLCQGYGCLSWICKLTKRLSALLSCRASAGPKGVLRGRSIERETVRAYRLPRCSGLLGAGLSLPEHP